MSRGIAKKTDPALWEKCKVLACKEGKMCKHSARKMQWAVQCYKSKGGRYVGKKDSSNKLHQWTKQKWRTASGKKSKGRLRYLPDKVWDALSPEQIRRTNRSKREGFRKGNQWVKQPKDVADIASKHRQLRRSPRRMDGPS
ncbi:MAG: hypothetical protein CBC12_05300 [Candidatus Puniceispirillum sp. TMED52]|nr:MAG: hypothetical protein CBC12_05300 [Candidatus Puniceispirillum sp. TMED52]